MRCLRRVSGFGCALLLAASACDGGDLPPPTGQLVLAGREVGDAFFWKSRTLLITRDNPDPTSAGPRDVLVWPLDEPAPTPALSGIAWRDPYAWPTSRGADLLLTGPAYELVYDLANRQAANLLLDLRSVPGDVGASAAPPRAAADVIALRSDGQAVARVRWDGGDSIIVGRPSDLRAFQLPEGAAVRRIAFLGADLLLSLNQTTASGDVVGVFRLDTASGALTTLVTPTPAEEWSDLNGLCWHDQVPMRCDFLGTIGCAINEPPCPGGGPPPCLIYYAKVDPDDASQIAGYLYDVNSGTTSKLAGDGSNRMFADDTSHWLVWGSASADGYTRYRNICSGAEGECPSLPAGDIAVWRPDGDAVAMFGRFGFLTVVNMATATCSLPNPNQTYSIDYAQYAPGSDRLLWVAAGDPSETSQTLWLADGDAQSAVAIAGGRQLFGTFSPGGRSVYVTHVESTVSVALGWVDLAVSPLAEKVVSTNSGSIGLRGAGLQGDQRALFIDHYNTQDGNGELVLVDLPTGARRTLARSVTGVAVADRTGAEGTDVAYVVRSHAGSPSDGLWLTTLPP